MINTILFDLDGTLLSMDTEEFIKKYFKALSVKLKDYFTSEEVFKYFWQSTQFMINDTNSNKTNEEAFFEDFFKHSKGKEEEISAILEDFYKNDFNKIQEVSQVSEEIVNSIKILKNKGYTLVVATNPLFPIAAILNRIEWAGLDQDDFAFITSFEIMHACKPQIHYYQEILKTINKKANECLMVGNDIAEDMVAKEIGIETYLVTDNLIGDINDNDNVDHQGSYKDFYKFVQNIKKL